ncbi:MAG: hypothetical protein IT325_09955 [Anaerolineae bacterium]|nr:hypothetical protein [Anaerolineae bacterium]
MTDQPSHEAPKPVATPLAVESVGRPMAVSGIARLLARYLVRPAGPVLVIDNDKAAQDEEHRRRVHAIEQGHQ